LKYSDDDSDPDSDDDSDPDSDEDSDPDSDDLNDTSIEAVDTSRDDDTIFDDTNEYYTSNNDSTSFADKSSDDQFPLFKLPSKYVASAVKEGVTPYVVDMTVEMQKISSLEDTSDLGSFPPLGNRIDVVVPVESFRDIKNTWGKYGLVRSMFSSSTRLFSFQFSSMDGLDAMLENGPWFNRNNLLILKKWHPNENLLKEDVSTIPFSFFVVGLILYSNSCTCNTAFSDNGLSAISTKLGTPLMLDSYTANMYMQSWGRSSYARVMIELRANVELKDNIIVAMPKITREGHYTCNVRVEYEWKPPRCLSYKFIGHIHEECPKNIGASEKKTVKRPS
ncbi:copia protein, partial [Tanacetum coccineum]